MLVNIPKNKQFLPIQMIVIYLKKNIQNTNNFLLLTNESINSSIYQSNNELINPSIKQSIDQSIIKQ